MLCGLNFSAHAQRASAIDIEMYRATFQGIINFDSIEIRGDQFRYYYAGKDSLPDSVVVSYDHDSASSGYKKGVRSGSQWILTQYRTDGKLFGKEIHYRDTAHHRDTLILLLSYDPALHTMDSTERLRLVYGNAPDRLLSLKHDVYDYSNAMPKGWQKSESRRFYYTAGKLDRDSSFAQKGTQSDWIYAREYGYSPRGFLKSCVVSLNLNPFGTSIDAGTEYYSFGYTTDFHINRIRAFHTNAFYPPTAVYSVARFYSPNDRDCAIPDVVRNLRVDTATRYANSTLHPRLSWPDADTLETSYIVIRENMDGSGRSYFEQIATLPANTTSYTDWDKGMNGQKYKVYSLNDCGESEPSYEVKAVVLGLDEATAATQPQLSLWAGLSDRMLHIRMDAAATTSAAAYTLNIRDMQGRTLMQTTIRLTVGSSTNLSLPAQISAGMYIVDIESGNRLREVRKIVLE